MVAQQLFERARPSSRHLFSLSLVLSFFLYLTLSSFFFSLCLWSNHSVRSTHDLFSPHALKAQKRFRRRLNARLPTQWSSYTYAGFQKIACLSVCLFSSAHNGRDSRRRKRIYSRVKHRLLYTQLAGNYTRLSTLNCLFPTVNYF